MAAQIERGLLQDFRERRRAAQAAARESEENFNDTIRPVAWTWVRVWIPGQTITLGPPVMGCLDGSGWSRRSRGECSDWGGQWRQRRPPLSISAEPTLAARVREDGNVHPEADIYCSVEQAEPSGDTIAVTCSGPRPEEKFIIELPGTTGAAGGPIGNVGVGDLVKVQRHLGITRRFTRDSAYWRVLDVPENGAIVVERSTCCQRAGS